MGDHGNTQSSIMRKLDQHRIYHYHLFTQSWVIFSVGWVVGLSPHTLQWGDPKHPPPPPPPPPPPHSHTPVIDASLEDINFPSSLSLHYIVPSIGGDTERLYWICCGTTSKLVGGLPDTVYVYPVCTKYREAHESILKRKEAKCM